MTKFQDIKAGDRLTWPQMGAGMATATVERVDPDAIHLAFGRASIYRAEFERMNIAVQNRRWELEQARCRNICPTYA